ncbi:aspartyl protease [Rhizoctonia solani AG-3 Rhs1AP]|uniref:Aspartyl protease n=2 Tax=Rhizoctonia solani AG-3 TaxID=1086053 RepID=A0A074S4W3_9AGAM|nr:aspartyl protease [Rhizoctonia solani AG-3 Rhs1AP]KEP45137.1 aspartyl protease [Rhizoctonia solani 123E]
MDIQIGTPGQSFAVIPGTYVLRTDSAKKCTNIQLILHYNSGSPSTWVYSTAFENDGIHGKNKFEVHESKTAEPFAGGKGFQEKRPDGAVILGKLYTDTIIIGGLSAEKQLFALVTGHYSPLDGILGLQPSNPPSHHNIIHKLVTNQRITSHIFSMYLSPGPDSELYIGGTNKAKYSGAITYIPLMKVGDKRVVLGTVIAHPFSKFTAAMIIDSGIPLIQGPRAFVSNVWGIFGGEACTKEDCGGSGYYTLPCDKEMKITFMFGHHKLKFTQHQLLLGPIPGKDNVCKGAIQAMDKSDGTWLLGAQFMKSVYTVFDMVGSQIGFATPIHLKEAHMAPKSPESSTGTGEIS